MELTSQQLKDIKIIELDLLRNFINVCEKLNLKYYLLGGTLLGAVRHKGFIPWDDDIDVGMPRGDYEIFISDGQRYLSEGLFIQSIETEPELLMNFAKLRNSNTTFVEESIKHCRVNHGVYIDVFPLDYYPDDEKGQRTVDRKNRFYTRRIASEYSFEEKGIKRKTISAILKLMYPSSKNVLRKRQELFKSVAKSNLLANYCGAWGKKEIVPADWYGDGVMLEFEGIQVSAPKEYDKWLTQVYGDYMKLPPKEKRVPHHYVAAVDLEKPYTVYLNGGK
ncbi:MAG: LicD family protein [Clostridia bacterium]|nr:LicD family protein [Clostridia bacterium]